MNPQCAGTNAFSTFPLSRNNIIHFSPFPHSSRNRTIYFNPEQSPVFLRTTSFSTASFSPADVEIRHTPEMGNPLFTRARVQFIHLAKNTPQESSLSCQRNLRRCRSVPKTTSRRTCNKMEHLPLRNNTNRKKNIVKRKTRGMFSSEVTFSIPGLMKFHVQP